MHAPDPATRVRPAVPRFPPPPSPEAACMVQAATAWRATLRHPARPAPHWRIAAFLAGCVAALAAFVATLPARDPNAPATLTAEVAQ